MNDNVGEPMMEKAELQQDEDKDNDKEMHEEIFALVNNDNDNDDSESHDEQAEADELMNDEEEEDDDDDDDDDENDQRITRESLWRKSFYQTCLRISRNDESLVQLDHPMDWYVDDSTNTSEPDMLTLNIFMNSSGYWTDAEVKLLGLALWTFNTHLRSLTLDTSICMCKVHRNVSENKSIHALQRGLAQSHLQQLTFMGLCPEFQELLLQGVFMPQHLVLVQKPPPLPSLTIRQLTLSKTSMNMDMFTRTLTFHWNLLTHLSLTSCAMTDDGMELLSSRLTYARALFSLDLSYNNITDVGVRRFCETCWNLPSATDDDEKEEHDTSSKEDKSNRSSNNNNNINSSSLKLQVLNFGYNDFGVDGLHLLFRAIQRQEQVYHNRELHTLILSGNEYIGHQGLTDAARMYLPNRDETNGGIHLQHLHMAKCVTTPKCMSVTPATMPAFLHMIALCDGVWDAFAHGLCHNTSLVSLDLGDNSLGAKGLQTFMEAIADHPTLRQLSLASNSSLDVPGIVQVAKMLPFVKLHDLVLNGTCFVPFQEPICDSVGEALLDGVRHNFSLTSFSMEELDDYWNEPIQFHVEFNKICRPLFCNVNGRNDSIATATADDNNHNNIVPPASIWPHALARLHQEDNVSHVYLCLLEQPWIIPTRSTYPGTNEATKKRKEI